ncbi:MAG: DHH family phosphoesterase [Oscillospiraceae bacterium]|nr:DHH family phosphoesterase [Oscillospiraceae bacterium]
MNLLTLEQTADWLRSHDRYLILTHKRPDGDAHGSAGGLALLLRALGKTAYVLPNPETTDKFLPYISPYWAEEGYEPETIVTVDLASEGLYPANAAPYLGKAQLSIDHHPSNGGYAAATCLDGSRASCGEVIYDLLTVLQLPLTFELAQLLYIAVSTDTGCFAFANTTANTFRVAGELAAAGLPIGDLNHMLFRTKSRRRFELEGEIMSGVEFYFGGRCAVITVTKAMMDRTGCTENDMDDIAALPGSIEGVLCGITLRELSAVDDCKVSVRTTAAVNANALCSVIGGGGHAMASGASPKGMTVEEMKQALLKALADMLPPEDRE